MGLAQKAPARRLGHPKLGLPAAGGGMEQGGGKSLLSAEVFESPCMMAKGGTLGPWAEGRGVGSRGTSPAARASPSWDSEPLVQAWSRVVARVE